MMVRVQADKGAIPFLLSGANCMCPGLTSAGGVLPDGLSENTPVLIMIEGKEHAIGVGILKMSSEQMYAAGSSRLSFVRTLTRSLAILNLRHAFLSSSFLTPLPFLRGDSSIPIRSSSRKVNKGVAIELLHFIGDGLNRISNDIGK